MTDDLDIRYKELIIRELEEREEKRQQKTRRKTQIKKAVKILSIIAVSFFLLVVVEKQVYLANAPTDAQLEAEYTEYFAQHCTEVESLRNVFNASRFDRDTQKTILRRFQPEHGGGEKWRNYIKDKMIGMIKRKIYEERRFHLLEDRKDLYKAYRDGCAVIYIKGDIIEIE